VNATITKEKRFIQKEPITRMDDKRSVLFGRNFFSVVQKSRFRFTSGCKKNSFTPPVRRFILLLSFLAWNIAILFGFFPCFKKVTKRMRNYEQIYGT